MTRQQFLLYEYAQFSIQAGLATRKVENAIYSNNEHSSSSIRKSEIRNSIRDQLMVLCTIYENRVVSEEEHIGHIHDLAREISTKFRPLLKDGNFRYGISQKILNLFLKYLWSSGIISETVHCPIDRIVKDKIIKLYPCLRLVDWTSMTMEDEYLDYIRVIKDISSSEGLSIGEWELAIWKRRRILTSRST